MISRRILQLAAFALAAAWACAQPAQAEPAYPWCAQLSEHGGGGAINCSFDTYEQCMETVHGIGGYCDRNPSYAVTPVTPHASPKRKSSG